MENTNGKIMRHIDRACCRGRYQHVTSRNTTYAPWSCQVRPKHAELRVALGPCEPRKRLKGCPRHADQAQLLTIFSRMHTVKLSACKQMGTASDLWRSEKLKNSTSWDSHGYIGILHVLIYWPGLLEAPWQIPRFVLTHSSVPIS